MKIINLTPYDITIYNEKVEIVKVIPRSGKIARIDEDKHLRFRYEGIPFYSTKYGIPILINGNGERVQFPEKKPEVMYIVSATFRSNYPRDDLWQPGKAVQVKSGQAIGYIGLSQ